VALPDVAGIGANAERYVAKGRDERCVLAAVSLGHTDDELLANVPWEVEVDVGDRDELAVDEGVRARRFACTGSTCESPVR